MITLEAVKNKGTLVTPSPKDGYYIYPSVDVEVIGINLIVIKDPTDEKISAAIDSLDHSEYVAVDYFHYSDRVNVYAVTYSETRPTVPDTMFYAVPSHTIGWIG